MATSSYSALSTHSRRKFSRQQLLRQLEILRQLPAPLPPTLPPSPPPSRSSSPAPGSKRKATHNVDQDQFKRPKTDSPSQTLQTSQPPQPQPGPSVLRPPPVSATINGRSEPCEDGELREDSISAPNRPPTVPDHADISSAVPLRRPRRGPPSIRHLDHLHDTYYAAGRKLKYSGDARFWSTYPSTHKDYRPLADPPPLNSPYHKHGAIISRLELVDALVCFTYALWNKDRRHRLPRDTWQTIEAFLTWCKLKWQGPDCTNDSEKCFLGLIYTIEAFVHARKLCYTAKHHLEPPLNQLVDKAKNDIESSIATMEQKWKAGETDPILLGIKSQSTPQMLPSPASIAPPNSANSTPTNRDGDSPMTVSSRSTSAPVVPDIAPGPYVPVRLLPNRYAQPGVLVPPHINAAANSVSAAVGPQFIGTAKDVTSDLATAHQAIHTAQQMLTLPMMARHFPRTFARMIHSSLSFTEEYEPDFEDEEGELLWPGQCITGEGLGWVCLMGQAMVREYGQAYSYRGLAGAVPKPDDPSASLKAPLVNRGNPGTHSGPATVRGSTSHDSNLPVQR